MKKIKPLILIVSLAALASCGGTGTSSDSSTSQPTEPGTSDTTPTESYNIIVSNPSTGATLAVDKTTAKKGETVTVTTTITDDSYTISKVLADSTPCTKTGENTYTFTMPNHPVTVSCELTIEGDVTLQGGLTAAFVEENGIYVAKGVKVANDTIFSVQVKDKSGNHVKMDITKFDRYKTFANISFADDDNLTIAGGATYDFFYDPANGDRPCYVKRTNVDVLPQTPNQLFALFDGQVTASYAVNPDNVVGVNYTNLKAKESYSWTSYADGSSLAQITKLGQETPTNFVYTKLEESKLTVVDNYTPGTNPGYEYDYTAKGDTTAFSGEYVIGDVTATGNETSDIEFSSTSQVVNAHTAAFQSTYYDHNMPSFETDIMWGYRVGFIIEDATTQANVEVASAKNEDNSFTVDVKSSKTIDTINTSSGADEEKVQEHYEYRFSLTFTSSGALLSGNYKEKVFGTDTYDFNNNKFINGDADTNFENAGTLAQTITVEYTYGEKSSEVAVFDTTPYFVTELSNVSVVNEKVTEETGNRLNVGDIADNYLNFEFAPSTALNAWQYGITASSDTSVIEPNDNLDFTARKPGKSTLTISTQNGFGISTTVDVNVYESIKVRGMYLDDHWGKFDELISADEANLYCGSQMTFGLGITGVGGVTLPLPSDIRVEIQGDAHGVVASTGVVDNFPVLKVDCTAASVTSATTLKIRVITDKFDPEWNGGLNYKEFTFYLQPGTSINDLVGTYTNENYKNASITLTSEKLASSDPAYTEEKPFKGTIVFDNLNLTFGYSFDSKKTQFSGHFADMFYNLELEWKGAGSQLGVVFAFNDSSEESVQYIGAYDEGFPVYEYFTKA